MPNYPPNSPHFSDNVPTSMGVIGTLGTSDTAGSAAPLPFAVDATTGAAYSYLITQLDSTNDSVTVGGGTVRIDATPGGSAVLTTHTLGTGGGTFAGTMIAPVGAGTYIYLTGISIIGRSGGSIDVGIANNVAGTTGAGVVARGFIPTAGGGLARDFNPPIKIGTNGTLAYFLVTAGTADFNATYWVGP